MINTENVGLGLATEHPRAAGSAFGAKSGAAIGFARLLIVLATSHFLFDSTAFDEFPESSDCFLNCFPISND